MAQKLPEKFLKRIKAVKNKRARIVLDHIAKHGSINTEELGDIGYVHPPRARMDALDLGFPIVTKRVKSSKGKSIGAYSFDLSKPLGDDSRMGRVSLPKREREAILDKAERKCRLCGATHDLQVDHRVPYQVAGETLKNDKEPFMVLDGSCNRRKSWTCQHSCENFTIRRSIDTCQSCYWANPEEHTHVAMKAVRRVDVVWQGEDATSFDRFRDRCSGEGKTVETGIRKIVRSRK